MLDAQIPTLEPQSPEVPELETPESERSRDLRRIALALAGLLLLAVFVILHLARDFFLPIALAVLLDFLLKPLVRALKRVRLPEPIGAGLVVLAFLTFVGATGYALSGPAAGWVARAPEGFQVVQAKLGALRRPFAQVSAAAEQVENATEMSGAEQREVEI